MPKFVFLWTDIFVFLLLAALVAYVIRASRSASLRSAWRSVGQTPSAMCAAVVLFFFVALGVLDSVHYRPLLPPVAGHAVPARSEPIYSPTLRSALDDLLSLTHLTERENTYSAPL